MVIGKTNNELPSADTPTSWKRNDKKYKVHRVKKILLHGGYMQGTYMNDLAIITVKKPFKFDKQTGYAPLASRTSDGNEFQIHNILQHLSIHTMWSVNVGLSGNLRKPAMEVSSRFPVNRQFQPSKVWIF